MWRDRHLDQASGKCDACREWALTANADGALMTATDAGLCATCTHRRVIRTQRSVFYLCQRSFTDARFPKYPRLPVLRCIGYTPGAPADGESAAG